jgi:hypothetical protein
MFNALKKRKKRLWQEAQERAAIEAYFSGQQKHFWQFFMGRQHPTFPPALADPGVWTTHFSNLLNPPAPPTPLLTPDQRAALDAYLAHCATKANPDAWGQLNTDFTTLEVRHAIMHGLPGKAADLEGLTTEALCLFLRHAEAGEALVQLLTAILNASHSGGLPDQLCTSKVIPIPKGQSPSTDTSQYRGIAVSSVFSRVYDRIVFVRANTLSEELGVRAANQCGFRHGSGPIDALFTVSHMIDKAKHLRQKLYLCQLDIEKAFDLTSRQGMLTRAWRLGIHGKFEDMLLRIYERVQLALCVDGQVGQPFSTSSGTKQGSQLSPLLFGWFLEQFTELVSLLDPCMGVQIGNILLAHILYADDINLVSMGDPGQLQRQLGFVELFCTLFHISVNPSKSKLIVFRPARAQHAPTVFTLGGHAIPEVDTITYMGVRLHCTLGIARSHLPVAKVSGFKALHAMLAKCRHRGLRQTAFVCRLFNILVEPVLSYGCQVWGPDVFMGKLDKPFANEASVVQLSFLRAFAGLSKHVHTPTLLREFNQTPVLYHWVLLAARLWNKACAAPADKLFKQAFLDNVQLYIDGCRSCWTAKLLSTLHTLGVVTLPSVLQVSTVTSITIDEKQLKEVLHGRFVGFWGAAPGDPRAASSQAVTASTYISWVGMGGDVVAPHLHISLPFALRQALLGIRMGAHHLEVQMGRYRGVPRQQRVCRVGAHTTPCVEDIAHFLLDCPAYDHIRARFPLLFPAQATPGGPVPLGERMRNLFATNHQLQLAQGILSMLQHRTFLAANLAGEAGTAEA